MAEMGEIDCETLEHACTFEIEMNSATVLENWVTMSSFHTVCSKSKDELYCWSVASWDTAPQNKQHSVVERITFPLSHLCCAAGMLLMGFLLRNIPVVTDGVYIDFKWSASLRNIALAVILARAGLGLDPKVRLYWLIEWFIVIKSANSSKSFLKVSVCFCFYSAFSVFSNYFTQWLSSSVATAKRHRACSYFSLRTVCFVTVRSLNCVCFHLQALSKLKSVCLRVACGPCLIEASTTALVSHFLMGLPWVWGFILG